MAYIALHPRTAQLIESFREGGGLAAGALTLDDARTLGLIELDGDEPAIRAVFAA